MILTLYQMDSIKILHQEVKKYIRSYFFISLYRKCVVRSDGITSAI